MPFAGALVLLIGFYFLYAALSKTKYTKTTGVQSESGQPPAAPVLPEKGTAPFVVGDIVVQDFQGREVSRSAAPLIGGGWVACPIWALFGGENIFFQTSGSNPVRIERGFWSVGDPVALWQIEAGKELAAYRLIRWKQSSSVVWLSLRSNSTPLQVEIVSPNLRGSLMSFPLPEQVRGAGILMQEDRIVGWTFAEPKDRGYLWVGSEEGSLAPGFRVGEFYSSAVSESREAHFLRVLAMGKETHTVERLKAFAYGFSLTPLLAVEDLPFQLRTQSIIMQMHSLASELMQHGSAEEVGRVLDERVLAAAGDPTLVKDAVLAVAQFQDYGRAIQYLDRLNKNIFVPKGRTPPEFEQFRAQIYKGWLRKIIEKGSYSNGTVVFEEAKRAFPDDAELQLLGVEVALAEKDWNRANEMLQGHDYPPAFKEWADRLGERIKNQADETAANIRFNPGEQIIPVEAYINGSVLQKFIIDTGASTSSIPKSALESLRIKVDETTPVKAVQSIAEVAFVYEVTLDSVELSGFRVNGLKALVIDLPGYKDYGLLGLNFLDNFRVEIDRNKGLLRLKKR